MLHASQVALLEPSWGPLGALLEPSWAPLGALLAPLGALLGPSWDLLGQFRSVSNCTLLVHAGWAGGDTRSANNFLNTFEKSELPPPKTPHPPKTNVLGGGDFPHTWFFTWSPHVVWQNNIKNWHRPQRVHAPFPRQCSQQWMLAHPPVRQMGRCVPYGRRKR